ncbi:hypothetical protein MWU61_02860 [Loktanella sp. F6476L]|uniref:hypothetical protein n=1 Tax=Loktanella sp. F6476L TaxID=2926405 RepID=UPI001FF4915B|nr:hypothetical protein [Loktanella sp. F6476L]MCK0119465.1 hypothetical protein [Loktanella sp. F6476L]
MDRNKAKCIMCSLMLSACAPAVDEELISYFDAAEENMSEARKAVDICLRTSNSFAWDLRESMFRQAGYVEAVFEDPERDIEEIRAVILIEPETEVVVQLGEVGGKSGCIVGLKGMSPRQSHDLALPWVRHFDGVSNEDRGQGLTHNAIQAWRGVGTQFQVFIAAYKTWEILETQGAAVRLSQ